VTPEMVLALVGGTGFIGAVTGLFVFLNTRGSTKSKGSADAMQAWQAFMGGATADREAEHERVVTKRNELYGVRGQLIDLVQELLAMLKAMGAGPGRLDPYQDRLDDIRRK
jgi:hypothetical protein